MDSKYDEKAKTLTLVLHGVDPNGGTRSASGKTMVLYSTRGNKAIAIGDKAAFIGINLYVK